MFKNSNGKQSLQSLLLSLPPSHSRPLNTNACVTFVTFIFYPICTCNQIFFSKHALLCPFPLMDLVPNGSVTFIFLLRPHPPHHVESFHSPCSHFQLCLMDFPQPCSLPSLSFLLSFNLSSLYLPPSRPHHLSLPP